MFSLNTALKGQHHAEEALYTTLGYVKHAVRLPRLGQYSKATGNSPLLLKTILLLDPFVICQEKCLNH
jgi:hypothetical protein